MSQDFFRLPPGGTIGIIGGGQLGRMTALAAAQLGYRCHVFTPDDDSPASQVCPETTVAPYDDSDALRAFARSVDLVTFEFENIPHEGVKLLEHLVPVRPNWQCLHIAQDRLREKDFLTSIDVPLTAYRQVLGPESLATAIEMIGRPAVLKTARLGYDGKGQVMIEADTDLTWAWNRSKANVGILERFVEFEREISVIVARGADGAWAAFDPVENRHRHHILDTTLAPAVLPPEVAAYATALAHRIAEKLDLVGLLAVEMFVTTDGKVIVNELAPRPHNSGHWTLDACNTSQFEQFVRAICGLPLGSPQRHSDAVMKNLIGSDVAQWDDLLCDPALKVHLYGKADIRSGRKMGHVTHLYPRGSHEADSQAG